MKNSPRSLLSALILSGFIFWVFYAMMPQSVSKNEGPLSEFSTQRALTKLDNIAKKPHYVGTENHKTVASYLETELQALGLETEIQEGYTLTDWGNLVKSKNILAKIKGTESTKALLLLSHYDSAPHSKSPGASDDGSGIATILEGLRTFIHNKTIHKNDIIVLFSDAEELGLNGAALFVTQHNWANEVGLVINFEARGTSGPAFMLMEVNAGNAAMVDGFTAANLRFPASNSLMYSIYKMLPNDTDLTVFRERGKIQGFNFAFIDHHYNYHTQQDDLQHLSIKSLRHQGENLMPLLYHFSNANLTQLDAEEDKVYFNTPFNFVSYPFSANVLLVVISALLFLGLVFIGIGKKILTPSGILKGFLPLFGGLIAAGLLAFLGWESLLGIYPQYNDILHGFTYNGHSYIGAFVFLTLSICFLWYRHLRSDSHTMNYTVAPIFLWLLINTAIVIYLPGAGFFILPVFASLIVFGYFIITQRNSLFVGLLFSLPAIIIFAPFITTFPIGLGLKFLYGSAVLTALLFGLLLPVLGPFHKKGMWSLLLFLVAVGFFINAHLDSKYESGKAKPNSLLYVYDAEKDQAVWTTYDVNPDEWTKNYLGDAPKKADTTNALPLYSKYHSGFTFAAEAPKKKLLQPGIVFSRDTLVNNQRHLTIVITPNRKVNRYDVFANENLVLHNLRANGAMIIGQKNSAYQRKGKKLLSYYVVDNEPLVLQFSINATELLDMELLESSFDLMENPLFSIPKRPGTMMPTPFVLNDAVVIRQKMKPTPKPQLPVMVLDTIPPPYATN